VSEAVITLRQEGTRPPPLVAETLDRLADAIAAGGPSRAASLRRGPHPDGVPPIPAPWSSSPGSLELQDALAALARTVAWTPATPPQPAPRTPPRERARAVLGTLLDELRGGRLAWTFTIRLMVCVGVAAVASEVLPLQRSYWVVLTVAIVVKPDNGSVFARALQRGIGTIVGVVLGAVILAAVPYGPWLLFPMAVLAAAQPYGRLRNFGLGATFMTPVVVLLIDLLAPAGWRLPEERLVDTLLGCAIVLLVGYASWPSSWHSYLPRQFAATLRDICPFMESALIPDPDPAARGRGSRLRRKAYRALGDLHGEYQRAMSEPAAVSRPASAWWPAIVALDEAADAATATRVAIRRGAPAPSPDAVRQLTAALYAVADAIDAGASRPELVSCPATRHSSRSPTPCGPCCPYSGRGRSRPGHERSARRMRWFMAADSARRHPTRNWDNFCVVDFGLGEDFGGLLAPKSTAEPKSSKIFGLGG